MPEPSGDNGSRRAGPRRLLYLCDWLPPDFGAVGQYSLLFARERAEAGEDVLLIGLTSDTERRDSSPAGNGRLTVLRIPSGPCDRRGLARRAIWTLRTNLRLLWRVRHEFLAADEVLFTGSPPYLLHFLAPLNLLLRKRLVYRITDFHPECLMAGTAKPPALLRALHRLTVFWRRRVPEFEVLGDDQRQRLVEIGVPLDRIRLKRDPSPVAITPETVPLKRPAELAGYTVLLYSGNFGRAHDHETFVEGYRRHHESGSGRVALWLNATGEKADLVERSLQERGLPVHRSRPVPLEDLPRLLVTPHAHLITLDDAFVGFVMPSKVYGCVESGRQVLFVGSERSDVHLVCRNSDKPAKYFRVAVGDPAGVAVALEQLADDVVTTRGANGRADRAFGRAIPTSASVRGGRTPK